MKVYIRKSMRCIDGELISFVDIANVSVEENHQGKGMFTNFLNHLQNLKVNIFIEYVINPKLALKLKKDFIKTGNEYSESYYKLYNTSK